MLQGISRSQQFGYFKVQNDKENQLDMPLVCRTKARNRLVIEKLRIHFGELHIGKQLWENSQKSRKGYLKSRNQPRCVQH